ncbi:MAG: glycosyltransferase family 4 protein [Acidobacteriota bacterium]
MRIGIDGHHLNGKPQGTRTYLLGLIREVVRLAPEDQFLLYSFRPEETRALLMDTPLTHRHLFPETARLRLPLVVPALEILDRLDLFHSQYICPPFSAVPEVVSIHDILFETHPELFEGAFSKRSVWLIRRSARRARYVLTVSEFCRRALLERYGLPEDRVVVTPDGVDRGRFRPLTPAPILAGVRARSQLDAPFLLTVGRLEPRKNLERLIRAFDRVRRKLDLKLRLVLAGGEDFRFESIHREAERLPPDAVRFLGPVCDEDLPALYNLARALIFPSLVEGFGMPVLEALACGTPVVSSRRGALPEVAADAVVWVEPEDETSIATGIETILTDSELIPRLREEGLKRATFFSWEESARRTLEVYRRCCF